MSKKEEFKSFVSKHPEFKFIDNTCDTPVRYSN